MADIGFVFAAELAYSSKHQDLIRMPAVDGAKNWLYLATQSIEVEALHLASMHAHYGLMELLIRKGVDVNIVPTDNEHEPHGSALWQIIQTGSTDCAKLLLDSGANANAKFFHGNLALAAAVDSKDPAMVQLLMAYGADPTISTPFYASALHRAVLCRYDNIVELLLSTAAIACLEWKWMHETPLSCACQSRDLSIMRQLLEAGANANVARPHGGCPLTLVIENEEGYNEEDRIPAMRMLLDYGADVNGVDVSPLVHAIRAGSSEALSLLLDSGADPEKTDRAGDTALNTWLRARLWSSDGCQWDALKILMDHGAGTNLKNNRGLSPLLSFCTNGEAGTAYVTKGLNLLRDYGADFNATEEESGNTALHIICAGSHHTHPALTAVEILCAYGLDVNRKNNDGETPLMLACLSSEELDFESMVQTLKSHGATAEQGDQDGTTALISTIANQSFRSFRAFTKAYPNVDVNRADRDDYAPIMWIYLTDWPDSEIVQSMKVLLEMGAKPRATDKDWRNILALVFHKFTPSSLELSEALDLLEM